MKKIYFILVVLFLSNLLHSQIVNIPDWNFKIRLLSASPTNNIAYNASSVNIKIDTNSDGNIQLSEALQVHALNIAGYNISSLSGIENFLNLVYLNCNNNQLSSLNIINTLTNIYSLNCASNNLAALNVSSLGNLRSLTCSNNQLTVLDVSNLTELQYVLCDSNQLTALNLANQPNLLQVQCQYNALTSLNLSNKINLGLIYCNHNSISNLTISNTPALINLDCSFNQLSSLDVSNRPNLGSLRCNNNVINSLNITNDLALQILHIGHNQIQNSNLSAFINLTSLDISHNQIQNIDLSALVNLITLILGGNNYASLPNIHTLVNLKWLYLQDMPATAVMPLTDANMPLLINLKNLSTDNSPVGNMNYNLLPNLWFLSCKNTGLTSISNIPTDITALVCEDNQLTTLDLTAYTNLELINFYNNQITSFTHGNNPNLDYINAGKNNIPSLDFSGLPALVTLFLWDSPNLISCFAKNGIQGSINIDSCPNLQYICADDSEITTIQNSITSHNYTNCHVNTYCTFNPGGTFYAIQGEHRYDLGNNGCNSSDPLFPHMKLNISNGTVTTTLISGSDGTYHYDVQGGSYTVTPVLENPGYFSYTSSTSGNIVFPAMANPYIKNFCIQPSGNNPDLEVAIYPLSIARPGMDNSFGIIYKNKGGTPQDGSVAFTYNDAVQDLTNSSTAPDVQNNGYLSWNFANLMPFETRSLEVKFNLNTPVESLPLNSGDILNYTASVIGMFTDILPIDNTATVNQVVVNSYDPNDKTCAEGTIISPDMVGQYVHYIVRFENTGTFAAENIVVRDMIDTNKFEINSLIPQIGSHPFTTRISNTNKVEFIFENINLPFDDANNDGYVAFKIKTKPTLVVGDTFSNNASIYFDYNFPIVTNTATTTIQTLANPDFEFSIYFTLAPNPARDILNIQSTQSVEISSLSIYNTLGQLVLVITKPTNAIDISNLKSGSYFIKVISDKGTSSSKFLKE